jgi:hypothetical protein
MSTIEQCAKSRNERDLAEARLHCKIDWARTLSIEQCSFCTLAESLAGKMKGFPKQKPNGFELLSTSRPDMCPQP